MICGVYICMSKTIKYNCELCQQEKTVLQKDYNKAAHHFCGRKCANKYLVISGKIKKPQGSCKACKTAISTHRTYCPNCWNHKKENVLLLMGGGKQCINCENPKIGVWGRCLGCQQHFEKTAKISDFIYRNSNRYSYIRQHASKVIKEHNIKRKCCNCEYSLITEICHIKAVSEFDKDALISEVNKIENLIILCPNCHKCFDKMPKEKEKILNKIKSA